MRLLTSLLLVFSLDAQVQIGPGNVGVVISGGGGSGTPGGSDTQCQYNNAGAFGGITGCTTNGTAVTLVAPVLGTPASGTLTNTTGLPAAGVVGTAAILGANTFTGQQIVSLNGAASTPPLTLTGTIFTGGSATTTKPQFLVEPAGTTSTAWSTAGTLGGFNGPSGFTGNLIDAQVNGTSFFKVNSAGTITAPSLVASGTSFMARIDPTAATSTLNLNAASVSQANLFKVTMTGTMTQTSGSNGSLTITPTYNQASGTAANTDLLINRTETAVGSGTQNLFDAQVAAVSKFRINNKGHIIVGGTAPTIASGFGTSPSIAGHDIAGRVTVGTGGVASTGTITFGSAWTTAPSCNGTNETTTLLLKATASTTTLVLASATPFTAADLLVWNCLGY